MGEAVPHLCSVRPIADVEVRAAMSEAKTSCIGGYDGPLDGLHVVEIALPRYARFFRC
jgi:hypothetical protein